MNLDSSVYRVLLRCIENYRKKKLYKKIIKTKPLFVELNKMCEDRFADDFVKERNRIIEESYDYLTIKIRNKDVIIQVKEFIDLYKKIYVPLKKLDEKIFLSLWIFSAFSDIVLNPKTEIKEKLFNISKYIVKKINELCVNDKLIMNKIFFIDLNKHINNYTIYFEMFLKEDRKIKLLESIETYITIKKNIIKIDESSKYNITEKKEIIIMMNNNLHKVKKFILLYIKNFDFKNIDIIVKNTLKLENLMIINYISIIEKKLNNKDYEYINTIFKEIQEFIKKMNKIKSESDLEEIIDPEYIIQLIKNDLLDKDTIINFGLKLSDEITKNGSASLSEQKKSYIQKLYEQNLTINQLMANIIYINFESIYMVYDEILSFYELVNELQIFT
jgi:hypothetical protein